MKKKYCLVILMFASFFLFSYTGAHADNVVVDVEFAKKMSGLYRNGGEEGYQLVLTSLDTLNRNELRELKKLIENDIYSSAGVIVNPPLAVEYRIIAGLLYRIDDRLGILDYNLVAEGRITRESCPPSTVSWYFFKPTCGPEIEIHIGSAIMPEEEYGDLLGQDIRIFVRVYRESGPNGKIARTVQKVELLKRDPSLEDTPKK